jgi:hypothetical protein
MANTFYWREALIIVFITILDKLFKIMFKLWNTFIVVQEYFK